jgi:hypothetical protein
MDVFLEPLGEFGHFPAAADDPETEPLDAVSEDLLSFVKGP